MTYISVAVRYDSERRCEKSSSKGTQDPWKMQCLRRNLPPNLVVSDEQTPNKPPQALLPSLWGRTQLIGVQCRTDWLS